MCRLVVMMALGLGCGFPAFIAAAEPTDDELAAQAVKLLERRCVSCHGTEKAEGELRLDTAEGLLSGGDSGHAIATEDRNASLLLRLIRHEDPERTMPPKDKLPAAEIALLERWVTRGATWPIPADDPALLEGVGDAWTDPRNPIAKLFGGKRLDLWSLKPVASVTPPVMNNDAWSRTALDRFILARLSAAGLTPAPEADRRTLARRLWFDLLGLPPSPEDVAAFVADPAPDVYEQLVDRLLASPHYGTHQARQWLDAVRYSDSNGFDWDEFRPQAWRYRDYVVRSFNADKPYQQFVREQLAGDELLAGPPTSDDEQQAIIATGYLRLGPQDNAASLFNEQDRSRAEWQADLVETTGSAFLGLTLACCRCHDHKTEPLSQADHYRLRAFFAPIKYGDDLALDLAAEQEAINVHNADVDADVATREAQHAAIVTPVRDRLRQERRAQRTAEELALLDRPADQLTEEEQTRQKELTAQIEPSDDDVNQALDADEKTRAEAVQQEITAAKQRRRELTKGLVATDAAEDVPATHVFYQGDHRATRQMVSPGFLSLLAPQAAAVSKGANPQTHGLRLTLAEWITSPDNPLAARVLVNRLWQSHFGRGLVATPNDFGLSGARPSHPELLDWLAGELLYRGGSLKALHREIVLSATYRQQSFRSDPPAVDTGNELLWRQNPRRLSAEQLRDSLLATSAQLLDQLGGSPVWPELPPEILQANPAFLDDNETRLKGWYPTPAEQQPVRSLYLVQKRTVRVPFLETFDLPENSTSCAVRTVSTVAPQALSLLNNPLAIDAAEALARRIEADVGANRDAQIARLFALTLQRFPTATERARCDEFLQTQSFASLCRAMLNLNEFAWVD